MRFLGNIEAKIDAKGRVFLPSTFRKMLSASGEESLVLRKDIFEDCLVIYPQSVWNSRMDLLRSRLNRWNKRDQMIYRQFVSDVELVNLDTNGRFLIPKRYLAMANISQEVRFTGMGDSIEIWAKTKQEQNFMTAEEFSKAMEEAMGTDNIASVMNSTNETEQNNTKELA